MMRQLLYLLFEHVAAAGEVGDVSCIRVASLARAVAEAVLKRDGG
jgi:hypothetical protein